MLNLPTEVTALLALFAPLFTSSVWYHAQILVIGAILTPGKRTVTAILSVLGLRQSRHVDRHTERTTPALTNNAPSRWARSVENNGGVGLTPTPPSVN